MTQSDETTLLKQCKPEPLSKKFGLLIDLFYGLALATGLEYTIPKIGRFDSNKLPVLLPLVVLSFVIGLSDWVIYHLIVVDRLYRDALRLVLDIVFPVIVFILFVYSNDLSTFLEWFTTYCVLTLLYCLFFEREYPGELPKRIWIPMIMYAIVAVITKVLFDSGCLRCLTAGEISLILSCIVGGPWFLCNFSLVREKLSSEFSESKPKVVD